jgi:hypothetical protein
MKLNQLLAGYRLKRSRLSVVSLLANGETVPKLGHHDFLPNHLQIHYLFITLPFEVCFFVFFLALQPIVVVWALASSFSRFVDHTQRRATVGRTPLDE